jgi:hypothetical protein
VYQTVAGRRQEVAGSFVLRGANHIGFALGSYDRSRALVIDPSIITYSTFVGNAVSFGIAVDASGEAFIAGSTSDPNFPVTTGLQDTFSPASDSVVISKLNASGSALLYSTFLAGTASGSINEPAGWTSIALDSAGDPYVAGITTDSDFPTSTGFNPTLPYSTALCSGCHVFVASLDSVTGVLVFSGVVAAGRPLALTVANGAAYVAGETIGRAAGIPINQSEVPTTSGVVNGDCLGSLCGFVVEINPFASGPIYATFLPEESPLVFTPYGIAADSSGAYVGGSVVGGSILGDGFVTKLSPGGTNVVYSTRLGIGSQGVPPSTGGGEISAIAVDSKENAYVTGMVNIESAVPPGALPATVGAFRTACAIVPADYGTAGCAPEPFVAKLSASGGLLYATYLGGATATSNAALGAYLSYNGSYGGEDLGTSIAVDSSGDAFVTGNTGEPNFPLTNPVQSSCGVCSPNAFVSELSPDGTQLLFSTYLGGQTSIAVGGQGESTTYAAGIATDSAGNVYVTGTTDAVDFPTTAGAFNTTPGSSSVFVTKILVDQASHGTISISPATIPNGTAGVLYSRVTFTAAGGQATVTISESGGLPSGMTFSNGTLSGTPMLTGSYPIIITATDSQGDTGSENLTLTINCSTITVGPGTLANGMVGAAYPAVAFTETGGVGGITFSETGLPTGIGMTFAAGVLSGTPTAAESFPITVTATDSNQCSGNITDTLTINSLTILPASVADSETITVTDTPMVTAFNNVTPINVAAPVAEFSAGPAIGFNGQSGSQTLEVSSIGSTSLTLDSATISGSPQFTITQIACLNFATSLSTTLSSGGACNFTISYTPSATPATGAATLVFTDNAALSNLTTTAAGANYTQSISLSGSGIDTTTPPPPSATVTIPTINETITVTDIPTVTSVTPVIKIGIASINPYSIAAGAGTYTVTVTLTNDGNVLVNEVTMLKATLSGLGALSFPSGTTLGSLAPGASASFVATFSNSAGAAGKSVPLSFSGSYVAGSLSGNWSVSLRSVTLP